MKSINIEWEFFSNAGLKRLIKKSETQAILTDAFTVDFPIFEFSLTIFFSRFYIGAD